MCCRSGGARWRQAAGVEFACSGLVVSFTCSACWQAQPQALLSTARLHVLTLSAAPAKPLFPPVSAGSR